MKFILFLAAILPNIKVILWKSGRVDEGVLICFIQGRQVPPEELYEDFNEIRDLKCEKEDKSAECRKLEVIKADFVWPTIDSYDLKHFLSRIVGMDRAPSVASTATAVVPSTPTSSKERYVLATVTSIVWSVLSMGTTPPSSFPSTGATTPSRTPPGWQTGLPSPSSLSTPGWVGRCTALRHLTRSHSVLPWMHLRCSVQDQDVATFNNTKTEIGSAVRYLANVMLKGLKSKEKNVIFSPVG